MTCTGGCGRAGGGGVLYRADLELSLQKKKQPIVNDLPQKYQREKDVLD